MGFNKYVATFEKVSFEQFLKDCAACGFVTLSNDSSVELVRKRYDEIKLPTRSTSGSAGYDFVSPFTTNVLQTAHVIPTGIRCKINNGSFLAVVPRSSYGFKYGMCLSNTIGIIDSDYYNADNEGHIMISVKSDKEFQIIHGDRFAQGILMPHFLSTNGNNNEVRTGGIGSTGK